MKMRVVILLSIALAAGGCAHRRVKPVEVVRDRAVLDLTGASDSELQQHLGERVTIHGKFSLRGKIGPFILAGGRPVYLVPKGSFNWGEPYASMEGRDVRVTGTLRFAHYPEPAPEALPEGHTASGLVSLDQCYKT